MPGNDPLRQKSSWYCGRCQCKVPLWHLHPANEPEPPPPQACEADEAGTVERWW